MGGNPFPQPNGTVLVLLVLPELRVRVDLTGVIKGVLGAKRTVQIEQDINAPFPASRTSQSSLLHGSAFQLPYLSISSR